MLYGAPTSATILENHLATSGKAEGAYTLRSSNSFPKKLSRMCTCRYLYGCVSYVICNSKTVGNNPNTHGEERRKLWHTHMGESYTAVTVNEPELFT